MALVIWLFAGGGEAEIRGLVPFFERHFPNCKFCRMTPIIRKPGCRPGRELPGHGKTGPSLICEVKERLHAALSRSERCNVIFVIDDLDCRNEDEQRRHLTQAIDLVDGTEGIEKLVGFAAPELEAWVIADWDNSVARHPDFRQRHNSMRHWLSTTKNVPFDAPESFGDYDREKDTCNEKLSDAIIESTIRTKEDRECSRYSKRLHTPTLLLKIDPAIVKTKCPLFGKIISFLEEYSQ